MAGCTAWPASKRPEKVRVSPAPTEALQGRTRVYSCRRPANSGRLDEAWLAAERGRKLARAAKLASAMPSSCSRASQQKVNRSRYPPAGGRRRASLSRSRWGRAALAWRSVWIRGARRGTEDGVSVGRSAGSSEQRRSYRLARTSKVGVRITIRH